MSGTAVEFPYLALGSVQPVPVKNSGSSSSERLEDRGDPNRIRVTLRGVLRKRGSFAGGRGAPASPMPQWSR